MNAWALSPEALEWIRQFIQERGIRSVLELGSGQSTLMLASLVRDEILKSADGSAALKAIAVEHDEKYSEQTYNLLKSIELEQYVTLHHCPLMNRWFDMRFVPVEEVDLILIDSPPYHVAPMSRLPAIEKLKPFIKAGTWIILDDYHRETEKLIVKQWLESYPGLKLIGKVSIDTGLAVMRVE